MSLKAKRIVKAVLDNLQGRSGIGNMLDEIDPDIYAEMVEELVEVVDKALVNW